MKRLIIKLFLSLCLWAVLPVCAQDAVHYYFRTMDIRNGLSQNTVYQILQDRKGFIINRFITTFLMYNLPFTKYNLAALSSA